MNETLSEKLRTVAKMLDRGTLEFEWKNPAACCCGVVAQILLGKTQKQIRTMFSEVVERNGIKHEKGIAPFWYHIVNAVCPITGQPTEEIFAQLYSFGLNREDIIYLECLVDPCVLGLIPKEKSTTKQLTGPFWNRREIVTVTEKVVTRLDYNSRRDLARYLYALADLKEKPMEKASEDFVPSPQLANRIAAGTAANLN